MTTSSPTSRAKPRNLVVIFAVIFAFIFGFAPSTSLAHAESDEFTFDDITYWIGQGTNKAALVVQWNDGKDPKTLVWGYRWDGEATGEDLVRAVAREDSRYYVMLRGDTPYGAALGGMGFDVDGDGDIALIKGNDTANPLTPTDGIINVSDYNFDDYAARDTDDRWRSGWYQNYWSYYVRDDASDDFGYSSVGMAGRQLADGAWDAWSLSPIGSPSDNVEPNTEDFVPASLPMTITAQPKNASATVGNFAEFSVWVDTEEYPTYQWQKKTAEGDWEDIPDANEDILSLSGVSLDDNGTLFRVKVTSPSQVLTSDEATLEVWAFSDVPADSQFFTEIHELAAYDITTGWVMPDGSRQYRPLAPIHRDAMAAFLYRLAGSPTYEAPAESKFSDVPTDSEFYKEISWLADKGITTGWPDGTFRPLDNVNRDAMAAFLYRAAGSPSYEPPTTSPFTDVATNSQFYTEICWLAQYKISTGWPDGSFRPVTPIARDAMAAFVTRYNNL